MLELEKNIGKILERNPNRFVFSSPRKNSQYKKASLTRLGEKWQLEKLTQTQAFHENFEEASLKACLLAMMQQEFTQLHGFSAEMEWSVRLTKKEKVLFTQKGVQAAQPVLQAGHNRQKNYLIPEGTVVPALVDMGVFTAEGKVVKAMYNKYRQINRFVELVDDELKNMPAQKMRIVDFGCGKSYLTFILYYYLTVIRKVEVEIIGLDLKKEVVEKCNQAAERYGYTGLHFQVGDIEKYQFEGNVNMVITLHACDTATDYALAKAVGWGAEYIFSVPCCQHELNAQINSDTFALLTRYGIIKERVSALMTDAIRGNLLEYSGYKTQLVEFVDFAHTPKNILIRAVKGQVPGKRKEQALQEVKRLCEEFSLSPTLLALLEGNNEK